MKITVWVCPIEGCGNYYASSNAGQDLGSQMVGRRGINGEDLGPDNVHTRATCPDCWNRSPRIKVERVPTEFETEMALTVAHTPIAIPGDPGVECPSCFGRCSPDMSTCPHCGIELRSPTVA